MTRGVLAVRTLTCVAVTLVVAAGVVPAHAQKAPPVSHTAVTDQMLSNADADAKNWLSYGKDYSNTRYASSRKITTQNVGTLIPRWVYQTGGPIGSFETTPLVVDGVMYLTTPFNHAIALDARTGKQVWRYEHKQSGTPIICCGPNNRGLAAVGGGEPSVVGAAADDRSAALLVLVTPDLLACPRVKRDRVIERRGEVHDAVHYQRRGLEGADRAAGLVHPARDERSDVLGGDLSRARVAGVAVILAVREPVLGVGVGVREHLVGDGGVADRRSLLGVGRHHPGGDDQSHGNAGQGSHREHASRHVGPPLEGLFRSCSPGRAR